MKWIQNPTHLFLFLLVTISILFPFPTSSSQQDDNDDDKQALIQFMKKLSPGNKAISKQWNMTSDPCNWVGVTCDPLRYTVREINLKGLHLSGTLDAASLCRAAKWLLVLKLKNNNLTGSVPEAISNCRYLGQLHLTRNRFTGSIPGSVTNMTSLVELQVSHNRFAGEVPDLARLPNLQSFMVQDNRLIGSLPEMDFANLKAFNVSNNGFSGKIPDGIRRFGAGSVVGNPELCGAPLPDACPGEVALAAAPAQLPADDPSTAVQSGACMIRESLIVILSGLCCLLGFANF